MAVEIIAGTFICIALTLLWFFNPTYDATEPKPIPHTLPILGNVISWARDRHAFFRWANAKAHHKPFSMLLAGQKHYVFGQPSDVATVFRKSKAFSLSPFIRMFYSRLFGMRSTEIDKLELDTTRRAMHKVFDNYLLKAEHYDIVVINYFEDLRVRVQELMDEIEFGQDGTLSKDAFILILDTMAKSSTVAYFGQKPVEVNPNITRDMSDFVTTGWWPLFSGVPNFLLPKTMKARDRVKSCLGKAIVDVVGNHDETTPDDISAFVQEHTKVSRSVLSRDDTALNEFSFMFGFMTNSVPTTYVTILRILNVPGLTDELRAEMNKSGFSTAVAADMPGIVPNGLPLLRSCYFESIRMHTATASLREVLETTDVTTKNLDDGSAPRTYTLKKGNVINMPSSLLHYNENVNPNPTEFVPKRFVSKELGGLGQNPSTSTRAFGGGTSYCPGRVFAERQIVGFLATILLHFDIEFADAGWKMPLTAEFVDVSKAEPRALLRMRKRELVDT